LAANPPLERRPGQRGRVKQSPARNLLERLWMGESEVLAFLDDLTIPFDNNQAEQDLRMLKVQQKIAGSFRAPSGTEAFARIRGYLSTMRKQGRALLAALETACTGQPLSPALDDDVPGDVPGQVYQVSACKSSMSRRWPSSKG